MRTAEHPRGWKIEFHPGEHHYISEGEKLTSVTTVIKRWFPQFDAEAVAKKKAAREGVAYEALLQEWERKRNDSANFGTKIHLMAELILGAQDSRAADHLAEDAREKMYLSKVNEVLTRIALGYEFIETEKIVFSAERKVAGTVDLLLRSRATGEYVVADWKTNREIKYQGFREETGHGLCASLQNCNFSHYSLQTSTYGHLLTSEGYLPDGTGVRGVLLHLTERNGQVTCDYLKTKDLRAISEQILTQV